MLFEILFIEEDVDPAVLPTFVFDLANTHTPNLASPLDVRAAARLKVDVGYF